MSAGPAVGLPVVVDLLAAVERVPVVEPGVAAVQGLVEP